MRKRLTAAWIALALALPGAAGADAYRLSTGDVLRIRVLDRPDLSVDAARLQPGGTVMLPRLGSIPLGGMTPDEARDAIQDRLRRDEGLSRPDVLVAIAEYRPVFVAGDVTKPGGYEFIPGMTVLQAITLAGGFVRPEPADANARLEAGRLRQALATYADQEAVVRVRLARLLAERDGAPFAEPPGAAALVSPDRLADLMATEAAIMAERARAHATTLETIERLKAELDNEVTALRAQLDAKERQSALVEQEAAAVRDLAARDLVSIQRSVQAQTAAIQIEADKREILAFIARAQTGRGRLDLDALNLRSARSLEILAGIKEQEDSLAELAVAVAGTRAQLAVADRLAAGIGGAEYQAIRRLGAADLTLVRPGPDGDRILTATLLDRMEPDDILFVPYQTVVPAGGPPPAGAASN